MGKRLRLLCNLAMMLCVCAARAQKADESAENIGIIVTQSAEQAQQVRAALARGMDFGVLAKEKSIDSTADDGGWMGRLRPSELRPELRDALQGVTPGHWSDVARIPSGFAVLTVFTKAPDEVDLDKQRILRLNASSEVRQSIVVSGQGEARSAFDQFPKPDGWARTLDQPCEIRRKSLADAIEKMQALLAEAEKQPAGEVPPRDLMEGYTALADLLAYRDDMEESIAAWKRAYTVAQTSFPGSMDYLEETLGISYFHLAEKENNVFHEPGLVDIYPPVNLRAKLAKPDDMRTAIEYFRRFLAKRPDDMEVRWLLNLAYMELGQYPAGVPAEFVVPQEKMAPRTTLPLGRFTDVAAAAGLASFKNSGGIVVDDFDNDGLLDVMASSNDMCEQLQFFHNNGDGTFTDRTAQAGLTGQLGGLNIVQADYNNDGCMDLLVLRGGWEYPMRRSLLRNNCDGTFTDVTDAAGLGGVSESQTAVWADIDNDGFVDLFIGNEKGPNQLFRNRGDGRFEDISHKSGIDRASFAKGVAAADYDRDGFVDFYVSNISDPNLLFHNNGDGTFTEIAKQAGVQAPLLSFATWFFDYDNDGWPDLFVTDYYSSVDESVRSELGMPFHVETPRLYHNLRNGTFEDVAAKMGLDKVYLPMGSNFGDIDNDGYLDMYLGMGDPSFVSLLPHVMLHNDGGTGFSDVTAATGLGEIHKGHGIAFADLRRNGQADIVANMGGAILAEKHALRLFRNPGNGNDWIDVRLVGVKTNRAAIGAQIKVTVEDDGGPAREIWRTVGDTSSFGGNPMEQLIGLGHGARITSLEVYWPVSRTTQRFTNVRAEQYVEIHEFAEKYVSLDRAGFGKVAGGQKMHAK